MNRLYPDYVGYAYTFGTPNCSDIRIAQQVVARSSWRHDQYNFNPSWFEQRKRMIWDTDGMLDMTHMHGGEFLRDLAQQIDVNLNGYLGDVVAGGGWIRSNEGDARSTFTSLQRIYKNHTSLGFFHDVYFNQNDVESRLYASRARRFTNIGCVNALTYVEQRKPFFDNEIITWAHSVPISYRENNRVYSAMLQRYFPKYFKDIPWQKTGKPAGILAKKSLPLRALSKLIKFVSTFAVRDPNEYVNYDRLIRQPVIFDELTDLLSASDSLYRQLSLDDWQHAFLIPYLKSNGDNKSDQILRAATVELYMRQVFRHPGVAK